MTLDSMVTELISPRCRVRLRPSDIRIKTVSRTTCSAPTIHHQSLCNMSPFCKPGYRGSHRVILVSFAQCPSVRTMINHTDDRPVGHTRMEIHDS